MVPMYWYRGSPNFGDAMAPDIVRSMFGIVPVHASVRYRRKLVGLGSIINAVQPDDVVWGSGLIQDKQFEGDKARFLAVRGPLTRDRISGDVPPIFGDPAILLPEVYPTVRPDKRFDIGIVPHYRDEAALHLNDTRVLNISPRTVNWRSVVDQIVSCDVIVSSSLHGIVVAEAFGIPTTWVQPTQNLIGGEFKFRDHFGATDRDRSPTPWSTQVSDLVRHAQPAPLNLGAARLKEAWMKDLWNSEWPHGHPS